MKSVVILVALTSVVLAGSLPVARDLGKPVANPNSVVEMTQIAPGDKNHMPSAFSVKTSLSELGMDLKTVNKVFRGQVLSKMTMVYGKSVSGERLVTVTFTVLSPAAPQDKLASEAGPIKYVDKRF